MSDLKEVEKYLDVTKSFFDKTMINIAQQQENFIFDKLTNTIQGFINLGVNIDEERLKRWIDNCIRLDNLDEHTVQDTALRKAFADKNQEIKNLKEESSMYQRALSKACNVLRELNYRYYNRDDIDFETSFIDEVKGEIWNNQQL